jgi:uncharacterized repeat protein (TIGR01451 family)
MNRPVVRYSAFASVAVAAVLGIVYFAFLSGSQADDGGPAEAKATDSASARAHDESPSQPDTLFKEPVGMLGQRPSQEVPDPFAHRKSDVVQTAYNDSEPRRLPVNPNADLLPSAALPNYGDRAQATAQLTAAGQNVETPNTAQAAQNRNDYLGLNNTLREAPAEAPLKKAPAAANSAATKRVPATRGAATRQSDESHPASSARQGTGSSLQTIDPAPVERAREGGTANADDLPTVVQRSRDAASSAHVQNEQAGLAGPMKGGRYSAPDATTQAAPVQSRGRNDSSQIEEAAVASDSYSSQYNVATETDNPRQSVTNELPSGPAPTGRGAISPAKMEPRGLITPPADYAPVAGSARPGSRQVEGQQVPQITIEKTAPQEVQVGKAARFELHLRNTGTVVAQGVEVHDFVPEGTQFVAANPPATPNAQGELVWALGALKPGDDTTIEVELTPITEGEAGSVAFVTLRAEAGARTRVTRPDLTLQVTAAKQVMIGHDVQLTIKVGNPGTGPATGVVLEEHVPPGLKHAAGAELEFEVGTLKPGETRELELTLTAAQAGQVVNQLVVRADGNLNQQEKCELEVIAPALAVKMDGPSKRYLERQATYEVLVSNPGTAPAKDIELVTRLPKGLKFVKANNAGHYDPQSHAVIWSLEELPPEETGTVLLTAIPVEPGEQLLRAEGRAKQNLVAEDVQKTVVEGLAALLFEVIDIADPIEVKGETQYQIRVMNQGSKAADNVQLAALLPPELKFVSADGPTRHATKGQQVIFEPLSRLAPKADTAYRIVVQGVQPGDVRMKIQLKADDLELPIMKEESTRVYSDE